MNPPMLMSISNKSYFLLFFIFLLLLFIAPDAQNQELSLSEVQQLTQKAKNKVIDYESWINSIGDRRNTKWYEEDIKNAIDLNFESDSTPIFNNLNYKNTEPIHIKKYLNSVKKYYSKGVVFTHTLENVQAPCRIVTPEYTYFDIKLTYIQKIEGFNYNFDIQQDSSYKVDVYVKFIVRGFNPLETDLDKIYKITTHKVTSCEDNQKEVSSVVDKKKGVLANIPQGNEKSILIDYAKTLVSDYANILNAVNNEKMNTNHLVEDYFYSDSTLLYNDIIQHSNKVKVFTPQAYKEEIKKYWHEDGIKFNYEIQDDAVKVTNGLGHMAAEVAVTRTIKTKNFKDKRNKLNGKIRVMVWFPIDEEGHVILERGSSKIYKVEEREYLSEEIKEKKNTYY